MAACLFWPGGTSVVTWDASTSVGSVVCCVTLPLLFSHIQYVCSVCSVSVDCVVPHMSFMQMLFCHSRVLILSCSRPVCRMTRSVTRPNPFDARQLFPLSFYPAFHVYIWVTQAALFIYGPLRLQYYIWATQGGITDPIICTQTLPHPSPPTLGV